MFSRSWESVIYSESCDQYLIMLLGTCAITGSDPENLEHTQVSEWIWPTVFSEN